MGESDTWLFAYGSLIWRADFDYLERRPAYVQDWARRFWQGSTDHRGVPDAPGRVVTLITAPGESCWGQAYRLDPNRCKEVLTQLDYREKGGYERLQLRLYFNPDDWVNGITYHATEDNPNFLGEARHADIIAQVRASAGPSGLNSEYVLRLDQALKDMGVSDPHVSQIADAIRH